MTDEYVTLPDGTVARVASLDEYNDAEKKRAAADRKAKAAAKRRAERKTAVLEDRIAEREARAEYRRSLRRDDPEVIEARRAANAERQRKLYHGDTPEDLERNRELRRQRAAAQRNTETPSQREARLASQRERVARHRAAKRATTSPTIPEILEPSPWVEPTGNLTE